MGKRAPESEGRGATETLRRLGLGAVALVAFSLTLGAAVQILGAVFGKPEPTGDTRCRPGVEALLEAVGRARSQASSTTESERDALSAFRRELSPVWERAAMIRAKCEQDGDKQALQAYRTVELLRYAEERAVRFEALDLAAFRKRAPKLTAALRKPPGAPSPP